ncbi:hypothetical protein TRIATDRAFT_300395 [Trichoderma atroviride IMI 206040]|uniref:Uncharacterized protein n=1 Tax=Hypocrea atroviridis (strain ATCC 20476 / IMI 206040) TaxID=452589 RepID=G9P017_HYPAI|nr:uncharacterized protein TRIATDRAFT_300395 [Trichoderma atroviride IMI 206040]EHK44063.1 hypothetical protein TRIATDRAFT_300395 [Trichoderma atroviride IMI 206040]
MNWLSGRKKNKVASKVSSLLASSLVGSHALGVRIAPFRRIYLLVRQHDSSRFGFMKLPWLQPIQDRAYSFVYVLLNVQAALGVPFPPRDTTELL